MKFRVNESYRDFSLADTFGLCPYNKVNLNVYFLAKFDEPKDLQE